MARMQGIRRSSENEEELIAGTPLPHSKAALSHLLLPFPHSLLTPDEKRHIPFMPFSFSRIWSMLGWV